MRMNKDIIIINSDTILTDENGHEIEVTTHAPELLEIWV